MKRFGRWWLHIRSAVRLAAISTLRFGFGVRDGLLFSLATALLTYLASRNVAASAFGLLSFPVVIAAVFVWHLGRALTGRSNLMSTGYEVADYERPLPQAPKRLYLGSAFGDCYPNGIRCTVTEPGGFASTRDRDQNINGWSFPREFPELIPPAPGRHHAVWLERTASGRWWKLAEFDFLVPDALAP